MALSKQKKQETVEEVQDLLNRSKLTVFAHYQGTSVQAMQELRSQAKGNGTVVRVIKNRLFKKAMSSNDNFKGVDIENLRGQLLYAFNESDEVAPAQSLATFTKNNPQVEFVGAITEDGRLLDADDVKSLASLPIKDQLRAQLVATIHSPMSGVVRAISGNIRGVINVLNARTEGLSNS